MLPKHTFVSRSFSTDFLKHDLRDIFVVFIDVAFAFECFMAWKTQDAIDDHFYVTDQYSGCR